MVPELLLKPTLLGTRQPRWACSSPPEVLAQHPDERPARNGYWGRYIRQRKKTHPGQAALSTSRRQPEAMQPEPQSRGPARPPPLAGRSSGKKKKIKLRPLCRPACNAAMVCWSRCAKPRTGSIRPAPGGRGKAARCFCRCHPLCSGARTIPAEVLRRYAGGSAPGRGHPHHRWKTPLA